MAGCINSIIIFSKLKTSQVQLLLCIKCLMMFFSAFSSLGAQRCCDRSTYKRLIDKHGGQDAALADAVHDGQADDQRPAHGRLPQPGRLAARQDRLQGHHRGGDRPQEEAPRL